MKKLVYFTFAFLMSTSVFAGDHDHVRNISDESAILEALAQHPKVKTLIIGCGLSPYQWVENAAIGGNEWRNLQGTPNEGEHRHEDAWTIAEDKAVNPNFLLDITKPVPESLHGRFSQLYLEIAPHCCLKPSRNMGKYC